MMDGPALLWLRADLRFDDNPALRAAADSERDVLCLYVLDDETPGDMRMGAAQRWWLHHSLSAFMEDLETRGGAMVLRRGDARTVVPAIAREIGAAEVFWNRRYMGWQTETDADIKTELKDDGIDVHSFNGALLNEPWEIETKSGTPYKVFTPYWRAAQDRGDVRETLSRVDKLNGPSDPPDTDDLDDWDLLPNSPNWAKGFGPVWTPGEKGARARLRDWLREDAARYDDCRNRPDIDATSRLSPHLHFGEVSPVTVWHEVQDAVDAGDIPKDQAKTYLSEIGWREFSHQLLYYQPQMTERPLDENFKAFDWRRSKKDLYAWQKGRTGYPIVDAGMRQLWQTGWMHNRVRMIVGSFLVKDLLIDWHDGMMWFWDCLVDADPANNTAQWQWVAGCGADASPFFRIFNPVGQSRKFDPNGDYIRKFVPELSGLSSKHIHAPWDAPEEVLEKAGVELGATYPAPIADHAERRDEALERYQDIK